MVLELDIGRIEEFGRLRKVENVEFRSYLKGQDFDKIDGIVHLLNREISDQIDCTSCGNCCEKLSPCIIAKDVDRLSTRLYISPKQVKDRYTEIYEGELFFKDLPCSFLKDQKCTIYSDRPEDCKSYPHLNKSQFISRLFEMIQNYSICPIVFNVFERLKIELNFK